MTTITTAKLREMAHTLGTTPAYLEIRISEYFGVTIDDTPADTEEQTMAMTITQEQYDASVKDGTFKQLLEDIGITITPAKPPEAMVKLAREIVAKTCDQQQQVREVMLGSWDDHAVMRVALAALQHAVNVVKGDGDPSASLAIKADILHKLGAGGRDAG